MISPELFPLVGKERRVVELGEVVMILAFHRQGMSVSEIARRVGVDRRTVRKYVDRGLEAPAYGPRERRTTVIDPYASYLRERVAAWPGLTRRRPKMPGRIWKMHARTHP